MEIIKEVKPEVEFWLKKDPEKLKKFSHQILPKVVKFVRENPDDEKVKEIINYVNSQKRGGSMSDDDVLTILIGLIALFLLHMAYEKGTKYPFHGRLERRLESRGEFRRRTEIVATRKEVDNLLRNALHLILDIISRNPNLSPEIDIYAIKQFLKEYQSTKQYTEKLYLFLDRMKFRDWENPQVKSDFTSYFNKVIFRRDDTDVNKLIRKIEIFLTSIEILEPQSLNAYIFAVIKNRTAHLGYNKNQSTLAMIERIKNVNIPRLYDFERSMFYFESVGILLDAIEMMYKSRNKFRADIVSFKSRHQETNKPLPVLPSVLAHEIAGFLN